MRLIFYFPGTSKAAVATTEFGDLWLEIKIIPLIDQKTEQLKTVVGFLPQLNSRLRFNFALRYPATGHFVES